MAGFAPTMSPLSLMQKCFILSAPHGRTACLGHFQRFAPSPMTLEGAYSRQQLPITVPYHVYFSTRGSSRLQTTSFIILKSISEESGKKRNVNLPDLMLPIDDRLGSKASKHYDNNHNEE